MSNKPKKSLLQELCIKKGVKSVYTSVQTGPSHSPTWNSDVKLQFQDQETKTFSGEPSGTKKESESSAAESAITYLESCGPGTGVVSASDITLSVKTALLVDVENLPKLISELPVIYGSFTIYAFVGEHHPLVGANFCQKKAHTEIKIISPSSRPDGTDTCMQLHVGWFLRDNAYDAYLIGTRDHFGGSLVDMITSDQMYWNRKKAFMVSTVDHILASIKKISSA